MDYEQEIIALKSRMDSLQQSFIQSQKNQHYFNEMAEDSALDLSELKPEVEGMKPYKAVGELQAGDKSFQFLNVPNGIMSIIALDSEGNYPDFIVSKNDSIVEINFSNALEYATTISLTVQQ